MSERSVEIVEVAPRDGLQNESVLVATEAKVELVRRLIDAGVRRMEVTSFVNPKRVPQMADAEALLEALPKRQDVTYIGLVMNRRGLERALAAGIDEINFVVCTTDSFNERNQGAPTSATLDMLAEVAEGARAGGVPCTVTVGTAFGCPFEGEVPLARLEAVLERVAAHAPREVALADTIGVAAPGDVRERFALAARIVPDVPLRCHFHNTRNTGIANALAAFEAGVGAIDASVGGIGGCPFAPAATGNIPTEDVVYMLERMGVATGLSLPRLLETATWLAERIGHPVPGLLGKAGIFPPERRDAA